MKKKIALAVLTLIAVSFVLAESAPMASWYFSNGSVTLNGKYFGEYEFAESFKEQTGYAMVDGRKQLFWLYNTYLYHNGKGGQIIREVVPRWVEEMGYVIDFDNIQRTVPDENVPTSIMRLMAQRTCDVAVALATKEKGAKRDYVAIYNFDADAGDYWTIIYYLY